MAWTISVCILNPWNLSLNQIHIWHSSLCQPLLFPMPIWHKEWQICLFLEKSLKNDFNNLYLHPKAFLRSSKSNLYLMSPSRGGPANLSFATFPKSISQKQWQIYFLFWTSLKRGWNNLYLHLYFFDMSCKSFSYLTSLSRRGPVNLSTTTFSNISLTGTITNLVAAWKFNQKSLQ